MQTGCRVDSSDLFNQGYGEAGVDFLSPIRRAANVVTDPLITQRKGLFDPGSIAATSSLRSC